MQIAHRPIEEKDIPVICSFPLNEEELFFLFPKAEYPLTSEQLKGAIAQRSDSTIVEADSTVVGFANFYTWELGGTCSIGNVVISPSARGLGVGRYLIKCMIEIAVSIHHAKEVRVSCFNQNTVALLLYSGLGFKPFSIEERRDKNGNRVALIHLIQNQTAKPLQEEIDQADHLHQKPLARTARLR